LAAPTGAARITEATAVASSVPIKGFFIVFIVVLTFSPLPSPFGANPSSGVVHVLAEPLRGHTAGTARLRGNHVEDAILPMLEEDQRNAPSGCRTGGLPLTA
jgi:hypothetical protein